MRTAMVEPHLMITVQSLRLLLLARCVREVLGTKEWFPIPGARQEIPGVVGWGHRAVAMLDLARLAPDLRPLQVGEQRSRLLILQVGESRLAVPADSVSSIIDIDTDAIHPRSVTAFPLSRSEVRIGDEVLPLFEPALILEGA